MSLCVAFKLFIYVWSYFLERVFPVPGDYTFVVPQGKDARIHWKAIRRGGYWFYTSPKWYFRRSDDGPLERLASMSRIENSSLPCVAIEKPATLVLKNVDIGYNGTYRFDGGLFRPRSDVTVFVAGKFLSLSIYDNKF